MVNSKLVTCSLCKNYYSDPRQIPCSHSFCFDCISGRFNEHSLTLLCPNCNRTHQYNSKDEFEQRCMRDSFLSSLVTKFKKSQSRTSANISSRPSSSLSNFESTKNSSPIACSSPIIAVDPLTCEPTSWKLCKAKYEQHQDESFRFQQEQDDMIEKARSMQMRVREQTKTFLQHVEDRQRLLVDQIEEFRQTFKLGFSKESLVDEFDKIESDIEHITNSEDIQNDETKDTLFEIENFEKQIDFWTQKLEQLEWKFPELTKADDIDFSTILGQLDFQTRKDRRISERTSSGEEIQNSSFKSEKSMSTESLTTMTIIPKKKVLWQIEYFSVPYHVRTWDNQLFVCDRYGSLAIYKFNKANDKRQKPSKQFEGHLFKDGPTNSTNDDEQIIIDSFTVSKLWIIIFRRPKTGLHGTIHLFSHDGKPIPNGKIQHNHPSRELTIDPELNRLWSLDQKQSCLVYFNLPSNKCSNVEEYFNNRHCHINLSKPFSPIHISVNKSVLAVLDKTRQAIHLFDKQTSKTIHEYVNLHHKTTHACWDMLLFSNNSLLIKLDETSTLKTGGPSKHIYLHLDVTDENKILGTIEETDAYGMMITANDEIFIGLRINARGIIKCYV